MNCNCLYLHGLFAFYTITYGKILLVLLTHVHEC